MILSKQLKLSELLELVEFRKKNEIKKHMCVYITTCKINLNFHLVIKNIHFNFFFKFSKSIIICET
jgi:hypothetical protein